MEKIVLKLYISGKTLRSDSAIRDLTALCEELPAHDIAIIDVLDHQELADKVDIMITPTLIKESPKPGRRIIGDLSDREKVLSGLGIEKR